MPSPEGGGAPNKRLHSSFVSGRPVQGGNRQAVQPQIDVELCQVMVQMIQRGAENGYARQGKDGFPLKSGPQSFLLGLAAGAAWMAHGSPSCHRGSPSYIGSLLWVFCWRSWSFEISGPERPGSSCWPCVCLWAFGSLVEPLAAGPLPGRTIGR